MLLLIINCVNSLGTNLQLLDAGLTGSLEITFAAIKTLLSGCGFFRIGLQWQKNVSTDLAMRMISYFFFTIRGVICVINTQTSAATE